jgi:hypothetical protein
VFIYVIDHFGDLTWMDGPEDRLYLGGSRDWGLRPIHGSSPNCLKGLTISEITKGLRQIWVEAGAMLVAFRLAGLSALDGHYAGPQRAPAISPCGKGATVLQRKRSTRRSGA